MICDIRKHSQIQMSSYHSATQAICDVIEQTLDKDYLLYIDRKK